MCEPFTLPLRVGSHTPGNVCLDEPHAHWRGACERSGVKERNKTHNNPLRNARLE